MVNLRLGEGSAVTSSCGEHRACRRALRLARVHGRVSAGAQEAARWMRALSLGSMREAGGAGGLLLGRQGEQLGRRGAGCPAGAPSGSPPQGLGTHSRCSILCTAGAFVAAAAGGLA